MKVTPSEIPTPGNRRVEKSGERDFSKIRPERSETPTNAATRYSHIQDQILKVQNELSRNQVVLGAIERSRTWMQKFGGDSDRTSDVKRFVQELVDCTLARNEKVLSPHQEFLEKAVSGGKSDSLDPLIRETQENILQGSVELGRIQIAVENQAAVSSPQGKKLLHELMESVVEDLKKNKNPGMLVARDRIMDLLG